MPNLKALLKATHFGIRYLFYARMWSFFGMLSLTRGIYSYQNKDYSNAFVNFDKALEYDACDAIWGSLGRSGGLIYPYLDAPHLSGIFPRSGI